jgi:hypothetical protein
MTRWFLLGLLVAVSSCASGQVRAARTALVRECASGPACAPGMGTCTYDGEVEALVCLCDRGCIVLED